MFIGKLILMCSVAVFFILSGFLIARKKSDTQFPSQKEQNLTNTNQTNNQRINNNILEDEDTTLTHPYLKNIPTINLQGKTVEYLLQSIINPAFETHSPARVSSPNSLIQTPQKKSHIEDVNDLILSINNIIVSTLLATQDKAKSIEKKITIQTYETKNDSDIKNIDNPLFVHNPDLLEQAIKIASDIENFFKLASYPYHEIPLEVFEPSAILTQNKLSFMQQTIDLIPYIKEIFNAKEHVEFRQLDELSFDLPKMIQLAFQIIHDLYTHAKDNNLLFHEFVASIRKYSYKQQESPDVFSTSTLHSLSIPVVKDTINQFVHSRSFLMQQIDTTFDITEIKGTQLKFAEIDTSFNTFLYSCLELCKILKFSLEITQEKYNKKYSTPLQKPSSTNSTPRKQRI